MERTYPAFFKTSRGQYCAIDEKTLLIALEKENAVQLIKSEERVDSAFSYSAISTQEAFAKQLGTNLQIIDEAINSLVQMPIVKMATVLLQSDMDDLNKKSCTETN